LRLGGALFRPKPGRKDGQILKYGVPVALATDDEGVSRSDMTREYLRAVQNQGLSYEELKRMARQAWNTASCRVPVCGVTATSRTAPQPAKTIRPPTIRCRPNARGFWKRTSEQESNGNWRRPSPTLKANSSFLKELNKYCDPERSEGSAPCRTQPKLQIPRRLRLLGMTIGFELTK
jgi:hypothetical protein